MRVKGETQMEKFWTESDLKSHEVSLSKKWDIASKIAGENGLKIAPNLERFPKSIIKDIPLESNKKTDKIF